MSVLLPLLSYCQSSLHNSLGAKALSSYGNQMHSPLVPLLTVWLCQSPLHSSSWTVGLTLPLQKSISQSPFPTDLLLILLLDALLAVVFEGKILFSQYQWQC